jgi:hypothetical protein
MLTLKGISFSATTREIAPSRHTISRWVARFKEQFHLYKDVLCGHFIHLGRHTNHNDFWQACLNTISLGATMRLCHVSGVSIP